MNSGTSLNPNAESYVPLSRRVGRDGTVDVRYAEMESKGANKGSVVAPRQWDPTSQVPQSSNIHGSDSLYAAGDSNLKVHSSHGSHDPSSYNTAEIAEKAWPYNDFEMDMAYLQMTFPNIAEESLAEVYYANKGDLFSTIDMLLQLEQLPGTSDAEDVPEYVIAPVPTDPKQKNVNTKPSASSSGSLGRDPVV